MKVTYSDGNYNIKMTPEELTSIRYGLNEGGWKLRDKAIFMQTMSKTDPTYVPYAEEANTTADDVQNAQKALNEAVQECRYK